MEAPFEAAFRPKDVCSIVGIAAHSLSRQTAYLIGEPAEPAFKPGASAKYSILDILLLALGRHLTDLGLPVATAKQATEDTRAWFEDVVSDPRFGTNDDQFLAEKFWRFLIGRITAEEKSLRIVGTNELIQHLTDEHSWKPVIVVNLKEFVTQLFVKIQGHMGLTRG